MSPNKEKNPACAEEGKRRKNRGIRAKRISDFLISPKNAVRLCVAWFSGEESFFLEPGSWFLSKISRCKHLASCPSLFLPVLERHARRIRPKILTNRQIIVRKNTRQKGPRWCYSSCILPAQSLKKRFVYNDFCRETIQSLYTKQAKTQSTDSACRMSYAVCWGKS